ncbi:hypothetical protein VNO78_06884 [Psophocarpus tetragonolobus]|uniref:CCHC-type domain-containing protein n=1 Tax=Psophocarpus tetragonolobus TaxID=3891 RepID=A0AAN9SVP7_PSOTE
MHLMKNCAIRLVTCYNCGKKGHYSNKCKGSKKGPSDKNHNKGKRNLVSANIENLIKCFQCKGPHMARDCVLTSEKCYNCGKSRHYRNKCNETKEDSNNGDNMKGMKNQEERTNTPNGNFMDGKEAGDLTDELVKETE